MERLRLELDSFDVESFPTEPETTDFATPQAAVVAVSVGCRETWFMCFYTV